MNNKAKLIPRNLLVFPYSNLQYKTFLHEMFGITPEKAHKYNIKYATQISDLHGISDDTTIVLHIDWKSNPIYKSDEFDIELHQLYAEKPRLTHIMGLKNRGTETAPTNNPEKDTP